MMRNVGIDWIAALPAVARNDGKDCGDTRIASLINAVIPAKAGIQSFYLRAATLE